MSQKVIVSVIVSPVIPVGELHEYDRETVPGRADVAIDASVDRALWADAALDAFHSRVAIKSLDDFRFAVLFDGKELECSDDHESYALAGFAEVVETTPGFEGIESDGLVTQP